MPETTIEQSFKLTYTVNKRLYLSHDDILSENTDVLVCSAFCGSYVPYEGTLISKINELGIKVETLANNTESVCDVYEDGIRRCWISKALDGFPFKRIACIELLDPASVDKGDNKAEMELLSRVFYYFRQMIEKASGADIPIKTITMTVPGTGDQGMETFFVASVLIPQCRRLLYGIKQVEEIGIFETNSIKYKKLYEVFDSSSRLTPKQVFISYSSKDSDIASQVYDYIEKQGVKCWKAPQNIPIGSNYEKEIPKGLQETYILLLILSENLEKSRWCYKEIGTAIGSGHVIIPCKIKRYDSSDQFNFLMDGEQIFPGYEYLEQDDMDNMLIKLSKIVNSYIRNHDMHAIET